MTRVITDSTNEVIAILRDTDTDMIVSDYDIKYFEDNEKVRINKTDTGMYLMEQMVLVNGELREKFG